MWSWLCSRRRWLQENWWKWVEICKRSNVWSQNLLWSLKEDMSLSCINVAHIRCLFVKIRISQCIPSTMHMRKIFMEENSGGRMVDRFKQVWYLSSWHAYHNNLGATCCETSPCFDFTTTSLDALASHQCVCHLR